MNFRNPKHWGAALILLGLAGSIFYVGWSIVRLFLETCAVAGGPVVYVTILSFVMAGAMFPWLQSRKSEAQYERTLVAILDESIASKAIELEKKVGDREISFEDAQEAFDRHWVDLVVPSLHSLNQEQNDYLMKIYAAKRSGLDFLAKIRSSKQTVLES